MMMTMMIVKMLCWWNKVLLFFLSRLFSIDNSFASNRSQLLAHAHSATCPVTCLPVPQRLFKSSSTQTPIQCESNLQFLQGTSTPQIPDEFNSPDSSTQCSQNNASSIVSYVPTPPPASPSVDPTTGAGDSRFWNECVMAHTTRQPSPPSSNISIRGDSSMYITCN